ncbi:dienelactone hydrolase family protein [Thiofilum flexile]|uniref:dienelactone hydrolase family protein n=1 Tax=Thiofilum flexile TaxID=125627 RepID=UPI00036C3B6B|nr:dienelactone hydrolase family protein [Thiofilum flexile]
MKTVNTWIVGLGLALGSTAYAAGTAVTYQVDGKDYEGYYSKASDKAPLVLLIHDWDGLTDYEKKRSDMLTELGYNVFAVDLFGKGVRPAEIEERKRLTGELYKDRAKMRTLMQGALDTAKAQGGDVNNAVAMGYCFGGAATLELARSGTDLKGFASFHGGLTTPEGEDYKNTKGEVLVMHGTADDAVTMDDFAALAKELEKTGIKHEMVTYSGAPHAFTVFGSERYREDADKKSWALFQDFLKDRLQPTSAN